VARAPAGAGHDESRSPAVVGHEPCDSTRVVLAPGSRS